MDDTIQDCWDIFIDIRKNKMEYDIELDNNAIPVKVVFLDNFFVKNSRIDWNKRYKSTRRESGLRWH